MHVDTMFQQYTVKFTSKSAQLLEKMQLINQVGLGCQNKALTRRNARDAKMREVTELVRCMPVGIIIFSSRLHNRTLVGQKDVAIGR